MIPHKISSWFNGKTITSLLTATTALMTPENMMSQTNTSPLPDDFFHRAQQMFGSLAFTPQIMSMTNDLQAMTQRQIEMSGGKYTLAQATLRASNAMNGTFYYPARNKIGTLSNFFATSVQADYTTNQIPPGTEKLWENLQVLKTSRTVMGPALADFAVQANIFYGYQKMPANQAAQWLAADGSVMVSDNPTFTQHSLLSAEVHETIHGKQSSQPALQYNMSWNIQDFQARLLTIEAAAAAGECVMALDFRQKEQDTNLWNYTTKNYSNETVQALQAYQAAIHDKKTHVSALEDAGKAAFLQIFKDQEWLDFYNSRNLNYYTGLLSTKRLKAPAESHFDMDRVRKAGMISSNFNFTAGIKEIPGYTERFGTNVNMRQAFDYASLEHLAATLGRTNAVYLKQLEKLEAENNRYIGVNMEVIGAVIQGEGISFSALQMMDVGATIIEKEISKGPTNLSGIKIDMRAP